MKKEERDLMIKMAKTLTEVGETVKTLEKKLIDKPAAIGGITGIPGTFNDLLEMIKKGGNGIPVLVRRDPGIESKIEHEHNGKKFAMDFQFAGAEELSYEQRMALCEKFLIDLERVFDEYKVKSLSGTYVRPVL